MNKTGTVWDVLIITAADEFQARIFEEQIHLNEKLFEYFGYYFVQPDAYSGIGSGLATVDALNALAKNAGTVTPDLKVLLIHSGGFSSRLPHASPFGKLFALMTDGKTVLEHKLETYKNLPKHLPSGIFVAASDTIETINNIPDEVFADISTHFVVFGHYSSEEVARNHGVFIPGDKKGSRLTISKILQKPSAEILLQEAAAQTDGTFITDSCYFMNNEVATGLMDLVTKARKTLSNVDICCYADFMRPIGVNANDAYVEDTTDPILRQWRRLLFDYFNNLTGKETLIVHQSSKFYHFGTVSEFLSHITEGGAFWKPKNKNAIHCNIEYGITIPTNSYIEFSRIYSKCTIGQHCLISGLDLRNIGAEGFEIPSNCLIICWPLVTGKYVTIYLPTDTDIKKDFPQGIQWFNLHLSKCRNFYNAQIFPLGDSPKQSLLQAMDYAERGINIGYTLISLHEAIRQIDRNRMRKDRFILYSMD